MLWIWNHSLYSHFIFFLTYEYFQQARVLDYTSPKKLASDKPLNLFGQFVTYAENKVLWLQHQGRYSQHLISLLTYKYF